MDNKPDASLAYQETTPAMRRMLVAASFLVTLLGISMYVLAETTERTAAWTIQPPLTAAFIGGAYFASCALELLSSRERLWANARLAVPGVVLFTFLMLGNTLLHLDRFHLGPELDLVPRFFGWVWLVTYVIVPPIFAAIWWRQRQVPGVDPPVRVPLSAWGRPLVMAGGGLLVLGGIWFLLLPVQAAAMAWPWQLTPLTGRSVGAWLVGLGAVTAHLGYEGDWARARAAGWGFVAFTVLQLVALLRFPGVLDLGDGRAWLYLAWVLGLGLLGAVALRAGSIVTRNGAG
jgi:hypothetical protein